MFYENISENQLGGKEQGREMGEGVRLKIKNISEIKSRIFRSAEQQQMNLKSAGIKLSGKKQPNMLRYFIGAYFNVSLTIFLSLYT